jgi:YspA, cpYpsA-related SLOG family
MRILITGDRHWRCTDLAERIVNRLIVRYGPDLVVIHGGAAGVDNAFSEACRKLGVTLKPYHANWQSLGNLAGPARNREMVASGPSMCVALHRDLTSSKGTKDCIQQALAAGIPTYRIEDELGKPRPVHPGDPRLN